MASLRVSLEASIKVLEKDDKEALSFFYLVGMLPSGIFEEELKDLWGPGWEVFTEKLLNYSLIQKKETDKAG